MNIEITKILRTIETEIKDRIDAEMYTGEQLQLIRKALDHIKLARITLDQ